MSVVRMVNSVGDYVAGESYEIPDDEADRFVILGYAVTDGKLSRSYSADEQREILSTHQSVTV